MQKVSNQIHLELMTWNKFSPSELEDKPVRKTFLILKIDWLIDWLTEKKHKIKNIMWRVAYRPPLFFLIIINWLRIN